jgi:hypothetical protein
MAEFVVSTPKGEAQNTVAPSDYIVLRDHLRSLIRMVRFELESKPLLSIHTVLLTNNYLAAVAHSTEGRSGHVAVFMRAVVSDLQDWSTESNVPPFLPHLHIEATTRRPSQPYCDQGRVVVSTPGSKKRDGKGVWVIRSKTRTDYSTLILSIMTVYSFSMASGPPPTQHGGFVESFLSQVSRSAVAGHFGGLVWNVL